MFCLYLFLLLWTAVSAQFTYTATSVSSKVECKTHTTRTTAPPTPRPTYSFTRSFTAKVKTSTITEKSTIFVTGSTTTYTPTIVTYVSTTLTTTLGTQTFESFVLETSTVGTLITTETKCTNGLPARITKTVYTGTATPPPGQPTKTRRRYPDYVNCTTDLTSYLTVFPTVTKGSTTITINPGTPGSTFTSTQTRTFFTYPNPPSITITTTQSAYFADKTTLTKSTSCPNTVTTTYAAQCSPPNLINQVNNNGILVETSGPGSASVFGGNGRDPSACCQLCQENRGCAGFSDFPAAGNCALYFTNSTGKGKGECGVAFLFADGVGQSSNAPVEPGQGSIVGAGCGIVQPVVDV